jgi:hypothetical protein
MTERPPWMLAIPNLLLLAIMQGIPPVFLLIAALVILANVCNKNIET